MSQAPAPETSLIENPADRLRKLSEPRMRESSSPSPPLAGWIPLLILGILLWAPPMKTWWAIWREDPILSHGPIVLVIAVFHLWLNRDRLREWKFEEPGGLILLGFSALVHILAYFADTSFFKYLSLIGMTLGAAWYLGGKNARNALLGPLGFILFVIPWPTSLVERIAFPLQLTSSAYAAMMGGILGLPIQREGIHLAVVDPATHKTIYDVLVAQECSGITSLMVLLALGYLMAYHTPVKAVWRVVMVALIVPLALIANTLRLTLVLLAGTYHSPALAQWVHDHEAPPLIFLCALGMMGVRKLILRTTEPQTPDSHALSREPEGEPTVV